MTDLTYYILCAVCVGAVLLGINMMSKVRSSVKGNGLSALAMIVAMVLIFVTRVGDAGVGVIIALLAAIGLASVIWAVVRAVLFQPAARQGVIVLICARGDGEDLEQQVRMLSLMRRERGIVGEILLVDCGLTEEGTRICRLLARGDRRVTLCKSKDIETYIT